jgi:hypothetical protein
VSYPHWLTRLWSALGFASPRLAYRRSAQRRTGRPRLLMEQFEERTLLSAAGLFHHGYSDAGPAAHAPIVWGPFPADFVPEPTSAIKVSPATNKADPDVQSATKLPANVDFKPTPSDSDSGAPTVVQGTNMGSMLPPGSELLLFSAQSEMGAQASLAARQSPLAAQQQAADPPPRTTPAAIAEDPPATSAQDPPVSPGPQPRPRQSAALTAVIAEANSPEPSPTRSAGESTTVGQPAEAELHLLPDSNSAGLLAGQTLPAQFPIPSPMLSGTANLNDLIRTVVGPVAQRPTVITNLDSLFADVWDDEQLLFPDALPQIDETLFPDGIPNIDDIPFPDPMPTPGDSAPAGKGQSAVLAPELVSPDAVESGANPLHSPKALMGLAPFFLAFRFSPEKLRRRVIAARRKLTHWDSPDRDR